MKRTLIHNAMIVNEGQSIQGSVVIEDGRIAEVLTNLHKNGRFAYARITAQKYKTALYNSSAEYTVEFSAACVISVLILG